MAALNNNRERVLEAVRRMPEGGTINDVAEKSKLSRNTARAYIMRLLGEGVLTERNVGPSKLIRVKA